MLKRAGAWEVQFVRGGGRDLVLVFSSVGHDPERMPSPEFCALASARGGRRALFFSDAGRSWGQDPLFASLVSDAVAQAALAGPIDRVLLMGSSMGGCLALQASHLLGKGAVLAFSPQWALGPGVADERWLRWSAGLTPGAGARAAFPLPEGIWPVLCHGDVDDLPQARAFPVVKGLDHLIFPGRDHSGLAADLKSRGGLAGLIEAALAGDRRRLLRIASGNGGKLRKHLSL